MFDQEDFSWYVEGLLTMSAGLIGLFGNSCSLRLFSRQKDHKIFHHLLFLLAIFDMVYLVSTILIFSLPKFNKAYSSIYLTYILPFILPTAHVGLMGSTYSTLALGIERYVAVCHPFKARSGKFKTKYFVWPVVLFTMIYNVPKFFELKLVFPSDQQGNMTDSNQLNRTDYDEMFYGNETEEEDHFSVSEEEGNITAVLPIDIAPTDMRINRHYIFIYIFAVNSIVNLLVPFVLLLFLNFRTFNQIKEFEQRLASPQLNVSFQKRPQSVSVVKEENRGSPLQSDGNSSGDRSCHNIDLDTEKITIDLADSNSDLQEELKSFFENAKGEKESKENKKKLRAPLKLKREKKQDFDEPQQQNDEASVRITINHGSSKSETSLQSLRKREVALARISIYIVLVFLLCHIIRIIPNAYEMIQSFLHGTDDFPWPKWVQCLSSLSHFLLTVTSSSNFYIYFFKHGRNNRKRKNQRANGLN